MYPTVSFLLPAYKIHFFAEALRSIKEQTYFDFKCIVSDDCSPENLREVFEKEVGDDLRFSYHQNDYNMGSKSLVSHWNLLLSSCSTDYFILASDDDIYDSHFLEEMMQLSIKYPDISLFRARCKIIDNNGIVQQEDALCDEFESQEIFLYRFWSQRISCIANYMFHTNTLRKKGGFVELPLAWGSDTATILNMCSLGVAAPQEILFSFRKSGFNISTAEDSYTIRLKHKAYFELYDFLLEYFKFFNPQNTPLSQLHYRVAKQSFMNLMYDLTINQWIYNPLELYKHYQKLCRIGYLNSFIEKLLFFWAYFYKHIKKHQFK